MIEKTPTNEYSLSPSLGDLPSDLAFLINPDEKRRRIEEPQTELGKELFIPKFALLGISGKGSVGNTSTADLAAKKYGIPNDRVFHAGEIFRDYRDRMDPNHTEHDSVAWIERPEELDLYVDEMNILEILSATVERPRIVEGKLVGALIRYLEQNESLLTGLGYNLPTPRFAVLKWADHNKRLTISRNKKGNSALNAKQIRRMLSKRSVEDDERFTSIHQGIKNYKNILEKNARDDKGDPLYQGIVDASNHTGPEEDFEDLNENLMRLGLVVPIELQKNIPIIIN